MKKFCVLILIIAILCTFHGSVEADSLEEMVFVEGGCYMMGDTFGDKGVLREEKPVHSVCVDDFYIDRYEVTNIEYERLNPGFKLSREAIYKGRKVSPGDRNPVINVNWTQADAYCKALGKRLPTEAEWEYAAREKGKKVRFGNGKDRLSPLSANFDATKEFEYSLAGEFRGHTTPVGSFPPNTLGLYDMAGNVLEWMSDWLDFEYYISSAKKEMNPKGPATGFMWHTVRSGSWFFHSYFARASARGIILIWQQGFNDVGIRCVR